MKTQRLNAKRIRIKAEKYVKQGKLVIHTNELQAISNHQIITEHKAITYDHIILATGFEETIMKQPIIKQLIHQHHAPLCSCGLPNISTELEWLPHLYVAGGLADLELGPLQEISWVVEKLPQESRMLFQKKLRYQVYK